MQFKRLHVDSTTGLVLVASPTMSDGGSFFFRGLTGGRWDVLYGYFFHKFGEK